MRYVDGFAQLVKNDYRSHTSENAYAIEVRDITYLP